MQQKIIIDKDDYDLLKEKYIENIDEEIDKGIDEFLFVLDDVMLGTLDQENAPTLKTIEIEKIYDKIYEQNKKHLLKQ